MWCFPRESSFKLALRDSLGKETHYKKEAETLKNHILENFTEEKIYNDFVSSIYDPTDEEAEWLAAIEEIEIL